MVGVDGVIYQGFYDIIYLGCFLNFVLMGFLDEVELFYMVVIVCQIDDCLSVICYLCGEGIGVVFFEWGILVEIGKGCIFWEGLWIVIFFYGMCLIDLFVVVDKLGVFGFLIIVVDVWFVKLIDDDFV